MHFRRSKSTALLLLEQSQLFSTPQYTIELLYEHGVLQSEKKNPDDSITLIKWAKASYKFSGVSKTYSFRLRRHNTGKIDLLF